MSAHNATAALVRSMLSRLWTVTVVQVKAVTNDGGVEPVGFVDVQPLVNQVDGEGNVVAHGTISHCPYQRVQGGQNAVIIDPKVGDIGIAVFASRDISSVVATKAQANPGLGGMFNANDALYIGGILNGAVTQYVQFSDDGITIHSPTQVKLEGPKVDIECATLVVNATTSATITTPTFTVNGDTVLDGDTAVSGNTTMLGAATVAGLATVATLEAGAAVFTASIMAGGKDIGAEHEHDLTGGGHTLGIH